MTDLPGSVPPRTFATAQYEPVRGLSTVLRRVAEHGSGVRPNTFVDSKVPTTVSDCGACLLRSGSCVSVLCTGDSNLVSPE